MPASGNRGWSASSPRDARSRRSQVRARPLPSVRRRVTSGRSPRSCESAAGISDEDSREAALAKILDIARGRAGRRTTAAIVDRVGAAIGLPRPSSRCRSCSGAIRGCSSRSRAAARWSRSSTTSTSRRRRSWTSSTTCWRPCDGSPILLLLRRATSCSRRARTGPRPRGGADDPDPLSDRRRRRRSSMSCWAASTSPSDGGSRRPPKAIRCMSSRSSSMLVETARSARGRWLGRDRPSRADRHPADRPGARRRPPRCAQARGTPGDRSGVGDRPGFPSKRSSTSFRRCGAGCPAADSPLTRSSSFAAMPTTTSSTDSATRLSRTPPTGAC